MTTTTKELPQFLKDLIASVPAQGTGIHKWLFKVARQLHAHRTPDQICALLSAATDGCGRHVPEREILAAVQDAEECAWRPDGKSSDTHKAPPKWPSVNDAIRVDIISKHPHALSDFYDASPTRIEGPEPDAEWFVDQLFPNNPLLCVGLASWRFATAPRESWRGKLVAASLMVPSAMSAKYGRCKTSDKKSMHTLENTGPRQYLVTEFDTGTQDEQATIINHLSGFAPLVMVLSSAGKSIHAWWNCIGTSEAEQRRFFRYAVSLGADDATWTRSQFVRLPQGWRHDKDKLQQVYYFNHNAVAVGGKS